MGKSQLIHNNELDKRHEVNALLGIGESCQYYGEQEQVEEVIKEVD